MKTKHFDFKSLEEIQKYSKQFADQRNWQQYQTPKNLVMALSVECSELLEHFHWLSEEESFDLDVETKQAAGDEISDVLFYLVRVADVLGIDLYQAAARKASLNEEKYPLAEARQK